MRSVENQVVPEDPRFLNENSSAPVPHGESARRSSHSELPHTELSSQTPYTLNFSFEELNTLGLDEGAPRHSNLSWQVFIPCQFSWCFSTLVQTVLMELGQRKGHLLRELGLF